MSAPSEFKPHDPELAQYVDDKPPDPFFDEQLRTLSADDAMRERSPSYGVSAKS